MRCSIYFHAIVADLFWPLLRDPWRSLHLRSFSTPQATAEAVYAASVNQLKRLLLIYRLSFKTAMLSVLWQTALIYVANAMMREGNSNGAEWRFYLELCVAGLEDLSASFRVFKSVAEGLLGMALERGVIDIDKVNLVSKELVRLGRHHVPYKKEDGIEVEGARWIIDIGLATTDPNAAQGANLAERFQELMLLEEFTTGEMS